jgi:hypothetical protein
LLLFRDRRPARNASRSDAGVGLRVRCGLLELAGISRAIGVEHSNLTALLLNSKRIQDFCRPIDLRIVPECLAGGL